MKVIFLDVDGVLNHAGADWKDVYEGHYIEDDKLAVLKELVDQSGAELVLSSSWKSGWSAMVEDENVERYSIDSSKGYFILCAKLHEVGLNLLSEIPSVPGGNREDEINRWMTEWPGSPIEGYVILDDTQMLFSKNNKHVLFLSSKEGLQPKHIEQALTILNVNGQNQTRKKILVVDDVEVNRILIRSFLNKEFDIFEAKDGRSALEVLSKNPEINAVITDIIMKGMDGVQLIKTIRSNPEYKNIIIIANTQYGNPDQEEKLLDLGADDFVYKPSNPKLIRHRVKNALLIQESHT